MPNPACAVIPPDRGHYDALLDAVTRGGGTVVDSDDANCVIWTDPHDATGLGELLERNPRIAWVALPFAGIEPFLPLLDNDRVWTCGKGAYAEAVAEHALGLLLAAFRGIGFYARQQQWSAPRGTNVRRAKVTILGGGEICRELLALLAPFDVEATVVRNRAQPVPGATHTVQIDTLHAALATADAVVLALALTDETRHILNADTLAAMPDQAWIVNVARGAHIDTDALVAALDAGTIGGAALDVTDPEPLPDAHPLWSYDNVIITPHSGNTPAMGRRMLAARIEENVRRFAHDETLLGPVYVELGY